MRKYPVYYNGNTYEVKWSLEDNGWTYEKSIIVYNVKKVEFLGIKFNSYKYLCTLLEEDVNNQLQQSGVDKNSEDMHIHQATFAVREAEKFVKRYNLDGIRRDKLKSWDGYITK